MFLKQSQQDELRGHVEGSHWIQVEWMMVTHLLERLQLEVDRDSGYGKLILIFPGYAGLVEGTS
jgi:hypothetical protein